MIFELAKEEDAPQIAKIHKREITGGFLSSLPLKFLEKIYLAVIGNDFCVVAKEGDEIIGFVAGTSDIKKLYYFFSKKYFFYSMIILSPKIFRLSTVKKIFETLFYPKKESDLPQAELLTIAVKKEFQGRGLASGMFKLFVPEMKNKGAKLFKVIVGESLKPAIKFYENSGFEFLKDISIHGKENSRVYIYKIL